MRISSILALLLTAAGCSTQAPSKHFVIPVGFSGVFKVEKVPNYTGGYQVDGSCYIFTIPDNGILYVEPDVFNNYIRPCNEFTVSFADGQKIILYPPLANPSDYKPETQMLLGLVGSQNAIWFAVGTHDQLSRFLEDVRQAKYQNLEQYLPPNVPF